MRATYNMSDAGLIVDRREILAGAAALGLSVIATSAAKAEDTPKSGGTLRLGMTGGTASDSLDPRTYADAIAVAYASALWNFLVEIDAKGNATGELLESWEAQPGAKVWTFKIRKGIHFTSGKEFDADDAIYSLGLHRGETKSPAKSILAPITEMKKLDSHSFQVTLSGGNADLPFVLSDFHLIMVPNGYTEFAKPDGTGAYTLESFEPGVRILLKRKPDAYWKPGRGNFDAVDLRYIPDAAARTQALITGQVDAVNRLDPKTANLVAKNPNLNVVRARGIGQRFVFVAHADTAPFSDPNVRLGLKYGIDRQKIIDTVFSGFASLGNDHLISRSNKYFNADLPQRAYDPDKASFYFKKAGISGPFQLEVSDGAFVGATDAAAVFQESLKTSGATLDLKRVSADGYWSNVWLKSPFCAAFWGARPTADLQFSQAFLTNATWNDGHWYREDFDKIIIAARAEIDDGKRHALYADAQKMVADDAGTICFAISDFLDGYSKRMRGNEVHARYEMNDERFIEKGWFA